MSSKRIYELTSIARPLEPQYPTNKAVLILLPAAAVVSALWQALGPGELPPVSAAITGALAAFATWALTRELAPDDNPGAFIAMALGVGGFLLVGVDTVLPTFVALFLVRIVNRSVGKPATRIDTLLVLILALGAGWSLGKPVLTMVGAVAFLLDALLSPPARPQLVPAMICLLAPLLWTGAVVVPPFEPVLAGTVMVVTMAIVAALYAFAAVSTRQLAATGDATGEPLMTARVRGGMLVGFLLALESLLDSGAQNAVGYDVLLWSCIAGVGIGNIPRVVRG